MSSSSARLRYEQCTCADTEHFSSHHRLITGRSRWSTVPSESTMCRGLLGSEKRDAWQG
jgi:hypothetical protein